MLATDATLTIYDGGAVPYSIESAHDVPDIDQNIIITHPDYNGLRLPATMPSWFMQTMKKSCLMR